MIYAAYRSRMAELSKAFGSNEGRCCSSFMQAVKSPAKRAGLSCSSNRRPFTSPHAKYVKENNTRDPR